MSFLPPRTPSATSERLRVLTDHEAEDVLRLTKPFRLLCILRLHHAVSHLWPLRDRRKVAVHAICSRCGDLLAISRLDKPLWVEPTFSFERQGETAEDPPLYS